jgi:putative acetyltransferase
VKIREGDLSDPAVVSLLGEHLEGMAEHSPFWTIWDGADLCGCGALKELDTSHGEIKSMRTAAAQLRKGVGAAMLEHIIDVARRRGYSRLSLETGSGPGFDAALSLYEKFGFEYCGPFADYRDDPFSRFMTLDLR